MRQMKTRLVQTVFFPPSFLKNSKFFNKHAKNRLIQSSIILILTWRCQTVSIQGEVREVQRLIADWEGQQSTAHSPEVCETRIWVKMMFI